jgi:hypothetical protein
LGNARRSSYFYMFLHSHKKTVIYVREGYCSCGFLLRLGNTLGLTPSGEPTCT